MSWHIKCTANRITVNYRCNIHVDIAYKNLKKLESHLIDIFKKSSFTLGYEYPELNIIGNVCKKDIDTIFKVIEKNKFCKPKTTYRSTSCGSPDMSRRHWHITKPDIIYERRPRPYYNGSDIFVVPTPTRNWWISY